MTFSQVVAKLEARLGPELPGAAAHSYLAPVPRRQWPKDFNPGRIRHAAGLLVVLSARNRAHVVLTQRADTLERHSGQISLPGGVVEAGETFERAALREAHEEIALPPGAVRVLGPLTPIDIPVSGFRLHPIVAAAPLRPPMMPSDGEVARILEVAVDDLLRPTNLATTVRPRDGREVQVPAFRVGDAEIWGATAMVLAEFLVLLGWRGPSST